MAGVVSFCTGVEAGAPVARVSGLTAGYGGVPVIEDITFELACGERVAVVGPNGAGKSTLLLTLAGLLPATHGEVAIYGHEAGVHVHISFVPQRSRVDWTFPVDLADVVMMGRVGRLGLFRWPRARDWDYVRGCLEAVGMREMAHRQIGELSGGQQQRVFIARALAQEAELMLMDEPFTGLDVTSQEDVLRTLEELRRRNVTLMVTTHDLALAAERFDRVMLLNHRLIGLGAPPAVLTDERLAKAYGGHLRLLQTTAGVGVLGDTCCGAGADDHERDH